MSTPEEIARQYKTPRAIEIERVAAYVEGTQYAGRPDWFDDASEAPIFERKPCINYPITKTAIGSHVGFVLGEGRWPTLTSATSEDDRKLDEEWGLNNDDSSTLDRFINTVLVRYARLKEVAREMLGDAIGSRSVAIVLCVRAGRLLAETVRASWCTPTLGALGECAELEIRYPYIETFYNDAERRWDRRCMLYRRAIDAERDTVYLPAVALEDGREPAWVVDPAKTSEHGLGFCPVLWYPFMRPCATATEVDGVALHAHQLSEIDCLNIALSQKQRAAVTAGDPQMVETGVAEDHNPAPIGPMSTGIRQGQALGPDGKPTFGFASSLRARRGIARKRGSGVIWRYPDEKSKVAYLTLPPEALKSIDDHAKDLRSKIAEAFHVVFIDITEMKAHAAMSGKALSFLFQHQLSFDDLVRDDFGDKALIPLVSMLLRIVLTVGRRNPRALYVPGVRKILPILEQFERETEDGGRTWMPPRLEPVWGPYFAPNEQDQLFVVQLVCQALQAGAISREMAVEKLAASGVFEVGSATEVVEKILADRDRDQRSQDGALHDAIAKLGGDGQGDPSSSTGASDNDGTSSGRGAPAIDGNGGAGGTQDSPATAASARIADAAASASKSKVNAAKRTAISKVGVSTAGITESVCQQLAEDFPPDAYAWVRAAQWRGPEPVPLDEIDFSGKGEWKASDSSDKARVDSFAEKIEAGSYDKPIILVNEPNNERLIIIDGHHRALAYLKLGKPANSYVGTVNAVTGPWDEMHAAQRIKPSQGKRRAKRAA